eukprot:superscaffoldBa00000101_g1482
MVEHGSCHLTLSKLKKLREKDKRILEFYTVATAQAKHLTVLGYSGCYNQNMTMDNDPTLPWTGSITAGPPEPGAVSAQPKDPLLLLGTKPKTTATSTLCQVPAEARSLIGGGRVKALVSLTPRKPEHWSIACNSKHVAKRLSPPLPSLDLLLANKFNILSLQEFTPLEGCSHLPLSPLPPIGHSSQQTKRHYPQPGPSQSPAPAGAADVQRWRSWRWAPSWPSPQLACTLMRDAHSLVVGTLMV